jgi:hypothetical protein
MDFVFVGSDEGGFDGYAHRKFSSAVGVDGWKSIGAAAVGLWREGIEAMPAPPSGARPDGPAAGLTRRPVFHPGKTKRAKKKDQPVPG